MVSFAFGQGAMAVPRLITAFRTSGQIINRGAAMKLGPFRIGGVFNAVLTTFGVTQIWDMLDPDPDVGQQMQELVQELVDSEYILWDSVDRRGETRVMEYVVVPVGDNAASERPYGMAYRPFSRTAIRKRDDMQDTYRRPRSAPRRSNGRRRS